jgi:hypothetical protein
MTRKKLMGDKKGLPDDSPPETLLGSYIYQCTPFKSGVKFFNAPYGYYFLMRHPHIISLAPQKAVVK